jgi:hypothetical protein
MVIHHPTTLLTAEDHQHPPHQSSAPLALAALDTTTSCAAITNRQHNNSIAITFHLHSFTPKLFDHHPGHLLILSYKPNMRNATTMKNTELIPVSWYCIYHYFMSMVISPMPQLNHALLNLRSFNQ